MPPAPRHLLQRAAAPRSLPVVLKHHMARMAGFTAGVALSAGLAAAPADAKSVSFQNAPNGIEVASPLHLEFGADGMDIRPAAEGLIEGTGHFHLLIDSEDVAEGVAIPFDKMHLHYGKGQTAADVPLEPGAHTLTLQMADALHRSYGPELRTKIDVAIK